jgi:hypothetical protein
MINPHKLKPGDKIRSTVSISDKRKTGDVCVVLAYPYEGFAMNGLRYLAPNGEIGVSTDWTSFDHVAKRNLPDWF